MKEKISRISLIVYAVLLILSGFLMSAAGGSVGWFCIMGFFAIPPIVAGPKRYKILGIIAFLIAIVLAATDYHAGKRIHDRREEIRKLNEVTERI
jgi:phosphotransferase system  glucose/maltose/N-acetylglucosamine-specific IIC component